MKPNNTHFDPQADEQAALWAARLDGSILSTDDRVELHAWLAASPAHRTLLASYREFSADLEQCLPVLVEAGAIELPAAAPQPARATGWGKILWSSTLAAAALVALALWFVQPKTQSESIATSAGHRNAITLADGSRVELNAQTTLHVEIERNIRRVRLTSGEAFFSVTKDPSRPFIVETPSGSVRVTGTAFDVRSESAAKFVVTVVEGSVQVRPGEAHRDTDQPVLLGAGDRLSLEFSGVALRSMPAAEINNALAWRSGQIVFVDVSLHDALAQFAKYHNRRLSVSSAAAELRVGGRFSLDDADGFLTALSGILPVSIVRDPSGSVQVDLRPSP